MEIVKNFFVEKDLKVILAWLGINYKKAMKNRIILTIFFMILTVFLGYYFNSLYIMICSLFVGIVVYKMQYLSVKNKKNNLIALKRRMFPSFIKKILILIRTNNVYNSLRKMVDYTDDPVKGYLQELISNIEKDKTIKPFNEFAKKMEFVEAYQIMSMLYTFQEHTMGKKHLISLESMVSQLYDNELDEIIESKKRTLWLYPNFCILSMLALVFSLAIFMFINVLGEISF